MLRVTEFERQVYLVVSAIPHGETRTYKWVAERIGRPNAVRAVGRALNRNPLPILVPCHRVVKSNGELGGYKFGLELKRRLLELERT